MLKTAEKIPLYQKIQKELIDYIEENKSSVLPKESELMKLFEVSRNTLRRAVSELTNEGILKPVQGCGTLVVKYAGLEKQDIGVVLTDDLKLTDPWVAAIMDGMRDELTSLGYNLHLFMCHEYSISPSSNSVFSHLLSTHRLLGVVLLSSLTVEEIEFFTKNKLNFVSAGFRYADIKHPFVDYDFYGTYSRILEHYYNKGLRKFACVGEASRDVDTDPCLGMYHYIKDAFIDFSKSKGLEYNPVNYNTSVGEQLAELYQEKPEVVIVPSWSARDEVESFIEKCPDWQPVLMMVYFSNEKIKGPAMVFKPEDLGHETGRLFLRLIKKEEGNNYVNIQPELLF